MKKNKIIKILNIFIALYLFYLGIKFIIDSIFVYKKIYSDSISLLNIYVKDGLSPDLMLIVGLYLILFGIAYVFKFILFSKILIKFSFIAFAFHLSYFLIFSIYSSDLNVSFDFVMKIFLYLGLLFSSIITCDVNNFDWRTQAISVYRNSLIIGVMLAIVKFLVIILIV